MSDTCYARYATRNPHTLHHPRSFSVYNIILLGSAVLKHAFSTCMEALVGLFFAKNAVILFSPIHHFGIKVRYISCFRDVFIPYCLGKKHLLFLHIHISFWCSCVCNLTCVCVTSSHIIGKLGKAAHNIIWKLTHIIPACIHHLLTQCNAFLDKKTPCKPGKGRQTYLVGM